MSLRHWWPLNGTTEDYVTGETAQYSGVTAADTGKFGSTYSFNGTDSYISLPSDLKTILSCGAQSHTIAFWIYPNEKKSRAIILGNFTGGALCYSLEYTSLGMMRFWHNGNPDWYTGVSVDYQTWNHFAIVYDGSQVSIFKNGVRVSSRQGALPLQKHTGNFQIGRDLRTGDTAFKGYINDFRIYDEALSEKQIKKLSQGLILHYDFQDLANPNLLHDSMKSSSWVKDGVSASNDTDGDIECLKVVTPTTPTSCRRIYLWTPSTWVKGTTYTVSFYARCTSEGGIMQASRSLNDKAAIFFTTTTWQKFIGKIECTDSPSTGTLSLQFPQADKTFYLRDIKLEKGECATRYLPNAEDSDYSAYDFNILRDKSGFRNNGTIDSSKRPSPCLLTESSQKICAQFVRSTPGHITVPATANLKDEFSVFVYAYSDWSAHGNCILGRAANSSGWAIGDFEDQNGIMCFYCPATEDYNVVTGMYSIAPGWHLFGFTFNGTHRIAYVDGVKIADTSFSEVTTNNISESIDIGGYLNTSDYFEGLIDDIRFYATALSEADVKRLYYDVKRLYYDVSAKHPICYSISNSSTLASLSSANPILKSGELIVVRNKDDSLNKIHYNIKKGNGTASFNDLEWKQLSEDNLKEWKSRFVSDDSNFLIQASICTRLHSRPQTGSYVSNNIQKNIFNFTENIDLVKWYGFFQKCYLVYIDVGNAKDGTPIISSSCSNPQLTKNQGEWYYRPQNINVSNWTKGQISRAYIFFPSVYDNLDKCKEYLKNHYTCIEWSFKI